MYGKITGPAMAGGVPAAVLAYTGVNILWLWLAVLGFTLLAAGLAVLRLIPRRKS